MMQNTTKISVKEGKRKVQNLSVPVLVIIKLVTRVGVPGWEY